jgi:hypothetical protein
MDIRSPAARWAELERRSVKAPVAVIGECAACAGERTRLPEACEQMQLEAWN